ncbi:hypothetical protein GW17_00024062 [Ensete ventricosum]|nr:hypothetical protein GW17_00024062 [Ensete ventricosum]RZS20739.1 hypothetical protein BHM03_00053296 [Ensete ventricosum]
MVEAMDTLGDTAFLLLLDRPKQRNDSGSKATREAIETTLLASSSSSKIARRRGGGTESWAESLQSYAPLVSLSSPLSCRVGEREGRERHLIEPQLVTWANRHVN